MPFALRKPQQAESAALAGVLRTLTQKCGIPNMRAEMICYDKGEFVFEASIC